VTDYRIEKEIVIEAPVDIVWRTVTEPDEVVKWFAERVDLEAVPGREGLLVFVRDGTEIRTPLVVETVEPPFRFSFRWNHPEGEKPAAHNSMLVEFTLVAESPQRTRLRVVETDLDLLSWSDDDKAHYAEDHSNGWSTLFDRLPELLQA
jgi:uncharacterized protein YndB with AHSA1/START domain